MRNIIALLSTVVLVGAGGQGPSRAPASGENEDFQLRVNAPVHVAIGDTASTVWVINDDATIDGVIRVPCLHWAVPQSQHCDLCVELAPILATR